MTVGILHPGAMGASIGGACRDDVIWCVAGRSDATRSRARTAGFREVDTLAELVSVSDVVVSVCPPAAAVDVADAIAVLGFDGIYVDANAVAPDTARAVGERFAQFVDGGIIGPPVHQPGTTRLYLAGDRAAEVARHWAGSSLDVRPIDGPPGSASALKAAYAGWTKGSAALLLAVRALARAERVESALLEEWAISQPDLSDRSLASAGAVAPKGWRFAGEMDEIAAAFAADGLPDGFHAAAADVYQRLADWKDDTSASPDAVIDSLLRSPGE